MSGKDRGPKHCTRDSPTSHKRASQLTQYQFESSGKSENGLPSLTRRLSWPRTFCNTNEPHHKATSYDVPRKLCAFSWNVKDWVEIDVIFVDDLDENWISEDLAKRLQLDVINSNADEYCHLETWSLPFLGSIELQWSEMEGKNSLSSHFDDCRVVPDKSFQVFLKMSLLPENNFRAPSVDPMTSPEFAPVICSTPPADDTFISAHNSPSSSPAGSFDGIRDDCKDDSQKAKSADHWMHLLQGSVHRRIAKEEGYERSRPPVKIAVLDTGVDSSHNFIKGAINTGRIQSLKNFVKDDSNCQDSFGHGTHVAALLLRVAPDVQLHILKVAKNGVIPLDHNIAEAIRWATNNLGVDIISMSFGIETEDHEIQKAIQEAFSRSILMFAAASNNGANFAVTYPARRDEVICVYAMDGIGTPFEGSPTPMMTRFDFAALGVGVKSAWPKKLLTTEPNSSGRSERRMTGTSFATPIVAGIAACIIEFAYMKDFSDDLLQILKRRQGMQKVIRELMVDKERRHNYHYVTPWAMFANHRTDEAIILLMKDVLQSS